MYKGPSTFRLQNTLNKSDSKGTIIKDRVFGGLKQNLDLKNQELNTNFKYIS